MRENLTHPFPKNLVNLASPRLGAKVIFATDEFFAAKERLIDENEPKFIPDKYDQHGKWMDGWESRRRRDEGYDFSIISLEVPGLVVGVDIDTRHFTGNHPPFISIDGSHKQDVPDQNTEWFEVVPKTTIVADSHNFIEVTCSEIVSHLRLNIFPDGGIARFRVYGRPLPIQLASDLNQLYELSAIKNGGYVVSYNDAHYGDPWVILTEGRGSNMGDGWETRRRRKPGNDWIIIALGNRSAIERIEVDTAHFKGNYPDRCSVEAIDLRPNSTIDLTSTNIKWWNKSISCLW